MSTQDHGAGDQDDPGFLARTRRRFGHSKPPEDCEHPHARLVDGEAAGDHTSILVCETCGKPLDAHDPTLRRRQHLKEARVCVECGSTYWTTGTRRSV